MMFIDFFTNLIETRAFTEITTQINIPREAIPTEVLSIYTDHGRQWLDKMIRVDP